MSPRPMGASTGRSPSYSSHSPYYYGNSGTDSPASAHLYPTSNNNASTALPPTSDDAPYQQHRRIGSHGGGGYGSSYVPSEPHAMLNYPKPQTSSLEASTSRTSPLRPRMLHHHQPPQGNNNSLSSFPPPPSSVDKRLGSTPSVTSHHQHQYRHHNRVASYGSAGVGSGSDQPLLAAPRSDDSPTPDERRAGGNGSRGVLQFVPALEEASRPTATHPPRSSAPNRYQQHQQRQQHHQHARSRSLEAPPVAGTSWDDIATPNDPAAAPSHSCMPIRKGWAASHASSTSSSSSLSASASRLSRKPNNVAAAEARTDEEGVADISASRRGGGSGGSGGGRISSRIASLFGGRASMVGKGETIGSKPKPSNAAGSHINNDAAGPALASPTVQPPPSNPAPPSPSYSSSSSGYVGWPGTQDKRGATVAVHTSSYEESSVGVGNKNVGNNNGSNASVASSTLSPPVAAASARRHGYEMDLQAAAEREMERGWDAQGLVDRTGASPPARPDPKEISTAASPLRNSLSSMRYSKGGHSPDVVPQPAGRQNATTAGEPLHHFESVSEHASLSFHNLFPNGDSAFPTSGDNAWELASNPSTTGFSKTSSAYFPADDANTQLSFPDLTVTRENVSSSYDSKNHHPYASRKRPEGIVRHRSASPSAALPTAEALAANDHFAPPHRAFVGSAGFRGLMEKTKEVPSLMDAVDSESNASSMSKATSTAQSSVFAPANHQPAIRNYKSSDRSVVESDVFDGLSVSKESDVFDNLSNLTGKSSSAASPRKSLAMSRNRASYPERIAEEGDEEHHGGDDIKLVVLPGGLATIQTTQSGFTNRKTASDYDENLTNSDVDQYGFAKTPGFHKMLSAGTSRDNSLLGIDGNIGKNPRRRAVEPEDVTTSESGSSLFSDPYRFDDDHLSIDGDLSAYYIPAAAMKKVLRKYRNMSDCIHEDVSLEQFEREEDEHRAFALFEMRSRIMEKDIERGLERRGGTVPVDDLFTTPYHRTAYRIRDAVIVSKAWRDGASPKDVVNSAILTRRAERTYYIRRPGRPNTSMSSDNMSFVSGISISSQRSYWWEPVSWLDDTDFELYRCPSLGPRNMRGSEMFTIGDCQSMLLKLTNEQCINLRRELNAATKKQIEAEYQLSDDRDVDDSMMTVAEMAYLGAMEEVKEISKKLVCAEQAFALVKDRIQRLVARYEHLLSKIDTESFAGASSVVTYESSYYSDVESDVWEEREKAIWARRAQRAEVKAELAAREALLAKQEVRMIQAEKQRELEALQQKLLELQSESSFHGAVDREHSTVLAKSMAMHRHDSPTPPPHHNPAASPHADGEGGGGGGNDRQKIDDVKKRFRDRMAARKQATMPSGGAFGGGPSGPSDRQPWSTQPSSAQQASSPFPAPGSRSSIPNTLPVASSSASPLFRSAGEEMYQQLDFYERSLKAVERDALFAP